MARGPALAGVAWIPIAWAAVWLARRVRWGRTTPARFFLVHGGGAVAASFVLNALFLAAAIPLGWEPAAGAGRRVVLLGVQWLHINAGAYLAMVALVHGVDASAARGFPAADDGASQPVRRPPPEPPALAIERGQGGLRIPLDEIRWLEADGDYVRVHTHRADHLVSRRMKELEAELGRAGFVRVHRSAMVNVGAVREVRHRSHGDFEAVLVDGTVVRVSRTRREALLTAYRAPSADVDQLDLEDENGSGGHESIG